jgi:hypothetical protein
MYIPLITILFSASVQLVSNDLLFGHGGKEEEAPAVEEVTQKRGCVQINRARQAKQA